MQNDNLSNEASELEIKPVSADVAKAAIVAYSSQSDAITAELYAKFREFKAKFWGDDLPDAVIAVLEMNDKSLAHYMRKNGYQIPHCIEFNRNFIALNFADKTTVEADRTIVEAVLLHEMIHLYQHTILDEAAANQQAAHGRSFRKEAKRVGVEGKGRLMACPYPVKMPSKDKIVTRLQQSGPEPRTEGEDGDEPKRPRRTKTSKPIATLFEEIHERAYELLKNNDLIQNFYHHLQTAERILKDCEASNNEDEDD